MSVAVTAVLAGVVVAVTDLAIDSFFLTRAVWLNNADPGMYATQSSMFLPYIGVAVRGFVYLVVAAELVRLRRLVSYPAADSVPARRRLGRLLYGCVPGALLNSAITVAMFWIASAPLTGLRDSAPSELVDWLLTAEKNPIAWCGVVSLFLDVVLLVLVVVGAIALRTRAADAHFDVPDRG